MLSPLIILPKIVKKFIPFFKSVCLILLKTCVLIFFLVIVRLGDNKVAIISAN